MESEKDAQTGVEMVNISIPRDQGIPLLCNALDVFAAVVQTCRNLGEDNLEAIEKMAVEYHNSILTMAPEGYDGQPH